MNRPNGAPLTVMFAFGTRPEAIKLAPLVLRARDDSRFRTSVVVTAQHREMLDQVLQIFDIHPDHDLDLQRREQTLHEISTRVLGGLDRILGQDRPDLLVVQGDTTTTFCASLSGFYHRIPVAHVEAGLRTHNRYSPFPEEINRRLTAVVTSLHLAPTPRSVDNLRMEAIPETDIVCTGNTVIDALQIAIQRSPQERDLGNLVGDDRRLILVTVHRREAWGQPLRRIGEALARLARDESVQILIPLHPNPLVRDAVLPPLKGLTNVTVTDPLPYGAFAQALNRADLVLTDSGGIQEEAPSLGKPVLVLRDTTERPEAVEAGTVELVGTADDVIFSRARALLDDQVQYDAMAQAVNPYGDGRAAERSLSAIAWYLQLGDRPADFSPSPVRWIRDEPILTAPSEADRREGG